MTMLTSNHNGSQYLHPDYLQPLPTTLDAKKSPLALLAQTCSSIGKDTSPTKSIIPPLEKLDHRKTPEKISSGHESNKRRSPVDKRDSRPPSNRIAPSIPSKDIPPLVPISSSSPNSSESKRQQEPSKLRIESPITSGSSLTPVPAHSASSNGHGSMVSRSPREHEHLDSRSLTGSVSPHHPSRSVHHSPSLPPSSVCGPLKSVAHPSLYSGIPPGAHLGYPGIQFVSPYDIPVSAHGYPGHLASSLSAASAAAAVQNSVLKANATASAAAAAMSPYVAYTRVRTASGATTLVPVCRDPYCSTCQLTMQNSHVSATCATPGCAQCVHEKTLSSLTAGLQYPGSTLPMMQALSAGASLPSAASSLASLYHPSALAAHQGLPPFVCNWVAGSEYCGKRYTTSEELLQHLRTHTSSMEALSASVASSYGYGLPSHLAASPALYPHHPPLSPNSLRRAYPTSLSPVSSMLASSRFHPYKSHMASSPALAAAAAAAAASQPYAGLPPYYSPYGLYGQRIGAVP